MNFRKTPLPINKVFKPFMKVAYIPLHAKNDVNHPDTEIGYVSSVGDKFVLVRFKDQLDWYGWAGTPAKACVPESLQILPGTWQDRTV